MGVSGVTDHDGVIGSGWEGAGRERARLACLLLANGLCLYVHVLALLGLLSRLSATMFAISRYVSGSGIRTRGSLRETLVPAVTYFLQCILIPRVGGILKVLNTQFECVRERGVGFYGWYFKKLNKKWDF